MAPNVVSLPLIEDGDDEKPWSPCTCCDKQSGSVYISPYPHRPRFSLGHEYPLNMYYCNCCEAGHSLDLTASRRFILCGNGQEETKGGSLLSEEKAVRQK